MRSEELGTCRDCFFFDMCDLWVVDEDIKKPCERYDKPHFISKAEAEKVILERAGNKTERTGKMEYSELKKMFFGSVCDE